MGMASISSCTDATLAHSSIQARSGCASKKLTLSMMEPAKSWSSCITVPIMSRQVRSPRWASGTPPTRTSPSCGSWMPRISFSSVVLPQPDGPAMATDSPGSIARLTPLQHRGSASE
jgi:hypothetical protein